ncbi:hypothetical protein PpBr36_02033 [Pyricularia pennisetigena]|uniref:hypothetical protein n=1 Tax=Pyricularia pennisetigena TaxID=1578925 RepID=UPI001154ECF9|nr:hypothetical protein PpBr36_02033 [Pyricularia pennisetigena]TLS29143.1 hypothetical protein PpBr36_02033 [Pyricularia pennisetigena]
MRFSKILQLYTIAAWSSHTFALETTGEQQTDAPAVSDNGATVVQRAPSGGSVGSVHIQPPQRRGLFSSKTKPGKAATGARTSPSKLSALSNAISGKAASEKAKPADQNNAAKADPKTGKKKATSVSTSPSKPPAEKNTASDKTASEKAKAADNKNGANADPKTGKKKATSVSTSPSKPPAEKNAASDKTASEKAKAAGKKNGANADPKSGKKKATSVRTRPSKPPAENNAASEKAAKKNSRKEANKKLAKLQEANPQKPALTRSGGLLGIGLDVLDVALEEFEADLGVGGNF